MRNSRIGLLGISALALGVSNAPGAVAFGGGSVQQIRKVKPRELVPDPERESKAEAKRQRKKAKRLRDGDRSESCNNCLDWVD